MNLLLALFGDCCIHDVYLVAPFFGAFQYNCFLSIKKNKKKKYEPSYHFSIHLLLELIFSLSLLVQ